MIHYQLAGAGGGRQAWTELAVVDSGQGKFSKKIAKREAYKL
jgi:hypothetical protein